MAEAGLGGLEAVYGRYSPRTRTDLGNLARRFGLVPTGGSDFHGATKPDLAVGTGTGDLKSIVIMLEKPPHDIDWWLSFEFWRQSLKEKLTDNQLS